MADSLINPVEAPSNVANVESGIASAAKYVGNGLRAAGESVVSDGTTVVGRNVTVGERVEAGVNLAADALSVATLSPEDAALERGAVFAIKEGVEHAPQLVEGAAALANTSARQIGEHAPQVGKTVASAFQRSTRAIEAAGHDILDSSAARGFIETKNAIYHVVEGAQHDVTRVLEDSMKAISVGKNFAVHAPELGADAARSLHGLPMEKAAERSGLKAIVAETEHAVDASVKELENSSLARSVKAIGKRIEPLMTVEHGMAAATGAAFAGYKSRDKIEHVANEALHHVEHAASSVAHHVGEATHATEHAVEQGVTAVTNGVKNVVDDVRHWTPDMSAEHFEKMLGMVRGGQSAPAVAPSAPARTQQQQHGLSH